MSRGAPGLHVSTRWALASVLVSFQTVASQFKTQAARRWTSSAKSSRCDARNAVSSIHTSSVARGRPCRVAWRCVDTNQVRKNTRTFFLLKLKRPDDTARCMTLSTFAEHRTSGDVTSERVLRKDGLLHNANFKQKFVERLKSALQGYTEI